MPGGAAISAGQSMPGAADDWEIVSTVTATDPAPLRVLFVADHIGYAGGVSHGATTYFVTTLASLPPARLQGELCVLAPHHAAAERFAAEGIALTFFGRAKWDPRVLLDMRRRLRGDRFDLVHVSGQKAGLLGVVAARLAGVPVVVQLHDSHRLPSGVKQLQRRIAPWVDRAVVPAEHIAEVAMEDYGMPAERVRLIPYGMRLSGWTPSAETRATMRASLGLAADGLVFAVVGRLDPQKGQDHLLRAFHAVHGRHPGLRLLVVGDGPTRGALEAATRELGLTQAVHFTGYRTDIPAILAAVDVVVVPSIGEEAFAYAALEGLAAGRPVVAYASGGLKQSIRDGVNGFLVPKGDEAALAAALDRFAADPTLVPSLGAKGPEIAREFSIEHHVERLDAIYREALARLRPTTAPA